MMISSIMIILSLFSLVNDVYVVSRDRYFHGETVWYQKTETRRFKGEIVAVNYDDAKDKLLKDEKKKNALTYKPQLDEERINSSSTVKKKHGIKPEDPDMPHAGSYTYSVIFIFSKFIRHICSL